MKSSRKKPAETAKKTAGWGGLRHLVAVLFLGVAVMLAYSASLHGTWALDDSSIAQYGNVENILNTKIGYRKIAYLSFLINKWIDPFNPLSYRLLNVSIHILNSVLVYLLALFTLGLPHWRERYGDYRFPVALISSAVFALHPININAVSYIIQRMTSLAAMFVLLALLSYLFARTAQTRLRASFSFLLSAVFLVLGIFSKENAIMGVPLILLYDTVFLVRLRKENAGRFIAAALGGIVVLGIVSVALQFHDKIHPILTTFLNWDEPVGQHDWTASDVYWTPLQHILTEFRVVGRYLFLMVFPLPRLLVFDWWGFPVSTGIASPLTTLLSAFFISGAIAFSLIKMNRFPFLSFGILWYFLALSLESFLAVGSDLYFEHRNYLPAAGLIFGAIAQAMVFLNPNVFRKKPFWIAVVILTAALGLMTFQRNHVWSDSISLWQDTLHKTPGNLRATISLGNAYLKASDLESAKRCYAEAVSLSESKKRAKFFQDSIYSLGMVYLFLGELDQAKQVIEKMDRKIGDSRMIGILKGFHLSQDGDLDGAIAKYREVLPETTWIDRVVVYTLLGDVYRKKGMPEQALENYRHAISIDPSFSAAYYGMGDVYMSMKDLNNAILYMKKTLELDPNSPLALSEMADISLITKEPADRAMWYADRALSNSPPFYQPYLAKANILIVMGRDAEAEEFYRKASERGLEAYMVPFSKARAYYMKGDRKNAEIFLAEVASMDNVPEKIRNVISESLGRR